MGVVFCDIDGVIFKHPGRWDDIANRTPELIVSSREYLQRHQAAGDTIVLATSRPDSFRRFTERELQRVGIPYHHLLMGMNPGTRVLINDRKNGQCRAVAIDVERDAGLNGYD
jgi:phosphoserine phosphatase